MRIAFQTGSGKPGRDSTSAISLFVASMPQGIAAPPFSTLETPSVLARIFTPNRHSRRRSSETKDNDATHANCGRLQHAGSCFPAPCVSWQNPLLSNAVKTGCDGIAAWPARSFFPLFSPVFAWGIFSLSTQRAGFPECGVFGSTRPPPFPIVPNGGGSILSGGNSAIRQEVKLLISCACLDFVHARNNHRG